jgi:hypothetical protein
LIITVVGSYKELELIREELSLNSELVIYHFEDCYRSGRGFTKDSLKTFMMNENIYSKQKFIQVAGYIFG